NVTGIQVYGGPGNDGLYGDYFYSSEYYFLGATQFENTYGRVKPGVGILAYGEGGLDRILGSLRDDTLDGGADHDYLDAYVGDDTALGGLGNDLMNGEEGQDDIQGQDDNDLLAGGQGADHILGGTGNDQLYGDAQYRYATWNGTSGTLVYGTAGFSGNFPVVKDAPETQAGDDVLEGGDGIDEIFGGNGDDLISGDAGNDINLQGEGGDDLLFGGDGDDKLWGDSSANAITGIDGNDYLDGGSGDDRLMGEGGHAVTQNFQHVSAPLLCKLVGGTNAAYRLAA
ncbi:MAG: hypothetical protein HY851_09975, partial [candidate division Zixibacteria bacterium]|nr:hypothetical protein [candidate division Zixibacteria bacterium]